MKVIKENQKNAEIKISVLISTFNKREFIDKTLDSLLQQTINKSEFEIILVDDCSTDDTLDIVSSIIDKFENYKLVQLDANSGTPAKPRNLSIDLSIGKYIIFVDGDDWLPNNALEILYNLIDRNNTDYAAGLTKYVFDNKTGRAGVALSKINQDNADIVNIRKSFYHLAPAGRIIRSSIIKDNKILFPEMIFGEDLQFFADVLLNVSKISTTKEVVYCANRYSENKSLVRTEASTLINRMNLQMNAYQYLLNKHKNNKSFKNVLVRIINKDILENKFFDKRFLKDFDELLATLQKSLKIIEKDFNAINYADDELNKYAIKLIQEGDKDKIYDFLSWYRKKDDVGYVIKNNITYYKYRDHLFKKKLHVRLDTIINKDKKTILELSSYNSEIMFLEIKHRKYPEQFKVIKIKKKKFKRNKYTVEFNTNDLPKGKLALTVLDNDLNSIVIKTGFPNGFYETVNGNLGFINKKEQSYLKEFDKYKGRKTKKLAIAKGIVQTEDGKGIPVRKWSGDDQGNPTFKNKHDDDIPNNSTIYIYATTKDGWARINSSTYKGWINLEKVQITEVY